MIEASCHTNLDGYERCQWPVTFDRIPNVGEYVQECARRGQRGKTLKVVQITHCADEDGVRWVHVELHR